mmetsp:Transcript_62023/g.165975  ORF Transcript_62023/g.165975 Transcript_62023/m.165975 type:complete len:243 (+) Transcript_62023:1060-1788(+)
MSPSVWAAGVRGGRARPVDLVGLDVALIDSARSGSHISHLVRAELQRAGEVFCPRVLVCRRHGSSADPTDQLRVWGRCHKSCLPRARQLRSLTDDARVVGLSCLEGLPGRQGRRHGLDSEQNNHRTARLASIWRRGGCHGHGGGGCGGGRCGGGRPGAGCGGRGGGRGGGCGGLCHGDLYHGGGGRGDLCHGGGGRGGSRGGCHGRDSRCGLRGGRRSGLCLRSFCLSSFLRGGGGHRLGDY